jgi:hypothetical protein
VAALDVVAGDDEVGEGDAGDVEVGGEAEAAGEEAAGEEAAGEEEVVAGAEKLGDDVPDTVSGPPAGGLMTSEFPATTSFEPWMTAPLAASDVTPTSSSSCGPALMIVSVSAADELALYAGPLGGNCNAALRMYSVPTCAFAPLTAGSWVAVWVI